MSREGGEQTLAGVVMSGESTSNDMTVIQETLTSLENIVLCQSIGFILSSSVTSKENAKNVLSPSQESISLTLSDTGENSLIENSSQKISPSIQEKLEKFENEEVKRKADFSPELTKNEKKKQKNKMKNSKK